MPFRQLDRDLSTHIGLRILLRGVFFHRLLKTSQTELSERLGEELNNGRLIATLERQFCIPKPLDIAHQGIRSKALLFNALDWHGVSEHALALAIADHQYLCSSLARCFKALLAGDLALILHNGIIKAIT